MSMRGCCNLYVSRCSIALGLVVGYITARLLKVDVEFRPIQMCVLALGRAAIFPSYTLQHILHCSRLESCSAAKLVQ